MVTDEFSYRIKLKNSGIVHKPRSSQQLNQALTSFPTANSCPTTEQSDHKLLDAVGRQ